MLPINCSISLIPNSGISRPAPDLLPIKMTNATSQTIVPTKPNQTKSPSSENKTSLSVASTQAEMETGFLAYQIFCFELKSNEAIWGY